MWKFAVPSLAISVLIVLLPALATVALAFTNWDGATTPQWVGTDNFRMILGDPTFWNALSHNFIWIVLFMTVPMGIGLVIASLLLSVRVGRNLFQTVYFLPAIVATAVLARVWQGMIYNPLSGVFGVLQRHGLPVTDPLAGDGSLYGVATVDIWHWWGFLAVIFFAALRQVDRQMIEAAQLEGSTFWQLMRFVLLPTIRPTIFFMLVMTVVWSFLVFDFIYILTQGGPAGASDVISTLSYRTAFYDFTIGKACAEALLGSVLALVATGVYVRLQSRSDAV